MISIAIWCELTVGENNVSHRQETIAEAHVRGGKIRDMTLALDSSSDHGHHHGNENTQECLIKVSRATINALIGLYPQIQDIQ